MVQALELPSLFADNMVLQQHTTVTFWGTAGTHATIHIQTGWGETYTGKSDETGQWQARLNTPEAGGPWLITIQTDHKKIELKNVLIGEVWLCSGQSNMAMPLEGWPPDEPVLYAEENIRNANYPNIRFFTVRQSIAAFPKEQCNGSWLACTPETASKFSATAFFFGKKLYNELNIPIGLIHSSWGGTPVESWMSQEKLYQFEEFQALIDNLANNRSEIEKLHEWFAKLPVMEINIDRDKPFQSLDFGDKQVSAALFDDSNWPVMQVPTPWEESSVGNFNGAVWFRKKVSIPDQWHGKELMLETGPIDDMDITYWNGQKIGSVEQEGAWNIARKYTVSADMVKQNENVIAIRIIDNRGAGGFTGKSSQMKVYPKSDPENTISLSGKWKYLPVAEYKDDQFYIYNVNENVFLNRPDVSVDLSPVTPSFLYNAMIHPLIPYTLKGVIWYQGESNTGNPEQYEYLFPAMIADWRTKWDMGKFPFYFVQIAPFDYGHEIESYRLREAQLKTMEKVDNTGMVVTLDTGNPDNIHPANKKYVGDRLARWALAKNYGHEIIYSGPVYNGMEVKENSIMLSFKYTGTGLSTPDDRLQHFIIAGQDKKFYSARAKIKGDRVIVSAPKVKDPVAVRYLWDNTSGASLFNNAGLPASSFRTDNWKE
jgi:sialate O-acetylesterase